MLLYLHGGGFVFGSRRTHRHLAAALSAAAGRPVLLLDYRRAPEHPFPAAADDALAGYRWLLTQGYAPEKITVIGDSAGGHLTAGLLADLSRRRLPMPAAAVHVLPVPRPGGRRADRPRRGAPGPVRAAAACEGVRPDLRGRVRADATAG